MELATAIRAFLSPRREHDLDQRRLRGSARRGRRLVGCNVGRVGFERRATIVRAGEQEIEGMVGRICGHRGDAYTIGAFWIFSTSLRAASASTTWSASSYHTVNVSMSARPRIRSRTAGSSEPIR
jgi:hypothetical protein